MMVVYIAEKHLFCTLRKEKEKKKSLSRGIQKEEIFLISKVKSKK